MSLKATIYDGGGSAKSAHVVSKNNLQGVYVLTEPLVDYTYRNAAFVSDVYGASMNINGTFGGTPLTVHDGTDTVAWTGSQQGVGNKVTFDSTVKANSGTKSILWNSGKLSDIIQLQSSATISTSDYAGLSLSINVGGRWETGDSISLYGFDTNTGLKVGSEVFLEDYININNIDVWQNIAIPLGAMNLSTRNINAFKLEIVGLNGTAPILYIDDIQLEQTGTPGIFYITPKEKTILHVKKLIFSIKDALVTTITDGTINLIPPDKLMNVNSLSNGVSVIIRRRKKTLYSFKFSNISELIESCNEITSIISDGTETYIKLTMDFGDDSPIRLEHAEEFDDIKITITDDLTGLSRFRCFAICKEENI